MDIEVDTRVMTSEEPNTISLSPSLSVTNLTDVVNATTSSSSPMPNGPPGLPDEILITFFSVILFLSMVGNVLVIVTLIQNKGMRTVTNVLLMNLAVSDLLLGVFCMPFTLADMLLRRFIFGAVMCKLLSYLQAVSVAVSVWTLVVISLERYFAICHPLRSRRWQTLSHAYKMISVVWLMSLACMIPIVVLNELQPMNKIGVYKCREQWPSRELELAFTIALDLLLLVVPLIIMATAYVEITSCLWQGIQIDKAGRQQALSGNNCAPRHQTQVSTQGTTLLMRNFKTPQQIFNFSETSKTKLDTSKEGLNGSDQISVSTSLPSEDEQIEPETPVQKWRSPMRHIRSTNYDKSLAAKKHVIRMLFIIVLEFFICWTPLYVVSTGFFFGLRITPVPMACIYLLAYISSCCNPITYCFMNRKFRQAFLQAFGCSRRFFRRGTQSSTNGASFYNRQSTIRTVVEDKEAETQL